MRQVILKARPLIAGLAVVLILASHISPGSAFWAGVWTVIDWAALGATGLGLLLALLPPPELRTIVGLAIAAATMVGIPTADPTLPAGAQPLTIASYNLRFRGSDTPATRAVLESLKADILFVQEVTPAWAKQLAVLPGYEHRRAVTHDGTHGLAILSKHRIDAVQRLNNDEGLPIAQCADLHVGQHVIAACNLHLASPAKVFYRGGAFPRRWQANHAQRQREWRAVAAMLEARERPAAIVAGDFNTLPREPLYGEISAAFTDLHGGHSRWAGTYPNGLSERPGPKLRIDYLFVRGLAPGAAEIVGGGDSDHLAIRAVVGLR